MAGQGGADEAFEAAFGGVGGHGFILIRHPSSKAVLYKPLIQRAL
jgi:hypothetical protein